MIIRKIDWIAPVFPACCFVIMFLTAYGGGWMGAGSMLFLGWFDLKLSREQAKVLPKRTYLV